MSAQEEENPLPSRYFRWLYDRVLPILEADHYSSYGTVCSRMHDIPFKALVPNDENRVADGAELRNLFLESCGGEPLDRVHVMYPDATIFEVLVALAKRANCMIEMGEHEWFCIFLKNLRLDVYNDWYCLNHTTGRIETILRRFNDRNYLPSGRGGLFPLNRPMLDQRHVEVWYQMGAFMTEHSMY
jgi:hypothetical protein